MNVTVTKSTKKSAVAKTASKAGSRIASPKAGSNGMPGASSVLKSAAGKLVKSLMQALKPADAAGKKPIRQAIAKPKSTAASTGKVATATATPRPAAKPPAKPAARQRAVATVPAAGTSGRNRPATHKVARSAGQAEPKAAARAASPVPRPDPRMRNNKADAGITDKIEPVVVSRASEVATKTPKTTPAVPADDTLLTEAQVLKMSDKDYMNAAQRAFFKARLQQLEQDLLKNAGETTEHLRETVLVPDPADRATIEEEHALELRTRDRERKLLKKVQQSIAAIDSGDYGWCEETGEPIGVARLLARPTATLSLEAQQRRELKQKLYGD